MHDEHVTRIKKWQDLRNVTGSAKPKAHKNRSQVQPKLVRRQAEWRYSALSEPFLASDKLYDLSPVTWEDADATTQNELLLNNQIRTKLDRVGFIDQLVRTDVDDGGVYIKVGWQRETKIEKVEKPVWQFVESLDEQYMSMIQEALGVYNDSPNDFNDFPENLKESVYYFEQTGSYVVAEQIGTELVDEEKIIHNHPTAEILDFENVFIDPNAEDNIDMANFAIISFETSKAKLQKDGRYKDLDKVVWSSNTPLNQPDHATNLDDTVQFKDDLRKTVVAYEYWGFYDINGTGELVPIVATWVGSTMIRMEENPFPDKKLPIIAIPYMPRRKSLNGEPDAELLEENQAILGAVTRGSIDLLGRSANGQRGTVKGMLDAVNKKRFESGSDYEFNQQAHPNGGMHEHTFPEIPQSALTLLTMQNQEAEALTGVKAFSGGLSGQAYGDVAAGIKGMLDAASKREMAILRRLASGLVRMGRKWAAMNAEFLSEEEIIRVTNDKEGFVKVRREELRGDFDIIVDISTAEIDEAKAQDLSFMLQTMGNNMDFGMTKLILMEIAMLKRMPELAQKIEKFEPAPDPHQVKLQELEIAKAEAEVAETMSKVELNQPKLGLNWQVLIRKIWTLWNKKPAPHTHGIWTRLRDRLKPTKD